MCRFFPANNITCLENVKCTGDSDKCPSEDTYTYLPVETMCQGSGRCLPNTTQCNSRYDKENVVIVMFVCLFACLFVDMFASCIPDYSIAKVAFVHKY